MKDNKPFNSFDQEETLKRFNALPERFQKTLENTFNYRTDEGNVFNPNKVVDRCYLGGGEGSADHWTNHSIMTLAIAINERYVDRVYAGDAI